MLKIVRNNIMTNNEFTSNRLQNFNPLVLAFMGDAVYDVLARQRLITDNADLKISALNVLAINKVRASAQAKCYDYLQSKLTNLELQVMKRGRNAHNNHCPKNANPIEYHKATGLEVLFGYLFFEQQYERLSLIFDEIYNFLEQN